MSQWYWDRIRLGFWPSYYGWDVKGYSQNLSLVLRPIKIGILALLLWLGHWRISQYVPMVLGTIKTETETSELFKCLLGCPWTIWVQACLKMCHGNPRHSCQASKQAGRINGIDGDLLRDFSSIECLHEWNQSKLNVTARLINSTTCENLSIYITKANFM